MFDRLVDEFSDKEAVTEELKAENQILWVQRMNNIHNRATEIVLTDSLIELTEKIAENVHDV